MFLNRGLNAPYRARGLRSRAAAILPWIFVLGVAAGSMLPLGKWAAWLGPLTKSQEQLQREHDSETIWRRAGNSATRHPASVIRTVDGDTFDARVSVWPGMELTTRVRLRGIDAPEIKASCESEFQKAEAASRALRNLLNEGEVAVYNIGPDKYGERVVADVSTKRTPNVSSALVAAGHARVYTSGRRGSWC